MNRLDGLSSLSILEKALDASWLRNEAISKNLSNIDTPGYKAVNVRFEEELTRALESSRLEGKKTREKHMPVGKAKISGIQPKLQRDNSTSMRLDGNNVDIDAEMSKLTKNTIMYNTLSQQISGALNKIKYVINEGRR
ncbi:MAG TPA: flagellar basal body rod protein FlgB [Clostridiales bacterium]|nr:flagellar basal body rod protein FlgB [Clostridiales bacterium]